LAPDIIFSTLTRSHLVIFLVAPVSISYRYSVLVYLSWWNIAIACNIRIPFEHDLADAPSYPRVSRGDGEIAASSFHTGRTPRNDKRRAQCTVPLHKLEQMLQATRVPGFLLPDQVRDKFRRNDIFVIPLAPFPKGGIWAREPRPYNRRGTWIPACAGMT
jgi:hypothetical protein